MADPVKITINVDSTAVGDLSARIWRLAEHCSQVDADRISALSEDLVAQKALFSLEFVPGQATAVMLVNAEFMLALAELEARYGL